VKLWVEQKEKCLAIEMGQLWAVLMEYLMGYETVTMLVIEWAALKVVDLVDDLDDEMAVWWDIVLVALWAA